MKNINIYLHLLIDIAQNILGSYKTGPLVSATQTDACSREYGSRDWAMNECNQLEECTHLDDYDCDEESWRYCVNVDIETYKNQPGATKSCTLLKPLPGIIWVMSYNSYATMFLNLGVNYVILFSHY